MGKKAAVDRLIWVIAIAGALLGVGTMTLLVAPAERKPLPEPQLQGDLGLQPLAGNAALAERVELLDPISLFLPVSWKARSDSAVAGTSDLEAGQELGRSFSGKLVYADTAVVSFPPRVPIPVRPADVLAQGNPDQPFVGIGRRDRPGSSLPSRAAYVEVVPANPGQPRETFSIREISLPGNADWQPLELLIAVDRIGLAAPPVVSRTSTVDAIDEFFRSYVAKGLHLGERLAPGSYVVTISR